MPKLDEPIIDAGEDRLSRLQFVQGIAGRVVKENKATGVSVGFLSKKSVDTRLDFARDERGVFPLCS
jgi:hypothetical protein